MKTIDKIDEINWIFAEIRESLEKIRNAQEENPEWETVAEAEEVWE
jgi:hypothetical protein